MVNWTSDRGGVQRGESFFAWLATRAQSEGSTKRGGVDQGGVDQGDGREATLSYEDGEGMRDEEHRG